MRCLTKNQFNFLTPIEIQCFSQYFFYQTYRCTKNVSRGRYYSTDSSGADSPDNSPLLRKTSLIANFNEEKHL
jgi:hypothetical protein